ncbi:MAG: MotA/TolQ/ExbB proton channel family protein [Deferribacteraceae bacterium]|jgi:biopolymer transport protein ExbB|nr:MotA/TolQ/ExbB proton channel family protein [Deferribacteraceae bacterium]
MFLIIEKGGIIMYPIILLSVIALAIFLERMFTLRRESYIPAAFSSKLKDLIKRGQFTDARNLCDVQDNAVARIAAQLIDNKDRPWAQLISVAEDAGKQEADKLERFQDTMINIVAIAPLLGLLGTVFGMISIFNVLSAGGIGNAEALSSGIAEALLTTAAGLSVAIPVQVCHYVVKYRADSIIKVLEADTLELVTMVSAQPAPAVAQSES